ncbi:hydrophobic protein [Streptomyces sp. NPDC020681]|uniref:hydrophobic protein n=1 Tax=Streptomyces sp. NPDC020681 TaxID=3365083 RepID=UPI0037AA4C29
MSALFLILILALVGLGFLNPLWWVAAAVLIFGAVHYGRGGYGRGGRGGDSDYGV